MEITSGMVKELRTKTGAGMMDCKEALQASDGDFEKAVDFLRKKGMSAATKRSSKAAKDGAVGSYIHMGGKIGVLVEVNCETDFVARNADFRAFVKDIAMHIAASDPLAVLAEDIADEILEKEKNIALEQAREQGKPEKVLEKIVEGRMAKFKSENALLDQPFVKDPEKPVRDFLNETIARLGENIIIRRFTRFKLGE